MVDVKIPGFIIDLMKPELIIDILKPQRFFYYLKPQLNGKVNIKLLLFIFFRNRLWAQGSEVQDPGLEKLTKEKQPVPLWFT